MNRLKLAVDLEARVWQKLPDERRLEFQNRFGRWDSLSYQERVAHLDSYFSLLEQRSREEIIRQAEERRLQSEKEIEERRLEVMRGSLDPIKDYLAQLGAAVGELKTMIGQTGNKQESDSERLRELEDRLKVLSQANATPEPPQQSSQPIIYVMTPLKDDCRYPTSKQIPRPTGCIQIFQEPDGHRYGTCTVGGQVRSKQILGTLLTNAIDEAGCPTNKLVKICKYLTYEKVRIS